MGRYLHRRGIGHTGDHRHSLRIQRVASGGGWYNGVYAVACFGSLLGGVALLLRKSSASYFFWASFAEISVMFGYAFAATDIIAHKGLGQVLPFPLVIAALGAASIWFAGFATKKGWIGK
jgi:hypothetical protein